MLPPDKIRNFLRNLISVFFICLLVPPFFYNRPEEGLDHSWNIAINLAYKYHLQFGKDFVFTYGPLGILNERIPITINFFVFLVFDLYFFFLLFVVLKEIFKNHFNAGAVLFIFLNIMLAQYAAVYQWYFLFFFFFLFSLIEAPAAKSYLVHAGILSILSFYFKVSLGMSTLFIFLISVTYLLIRKKWSIRWFATVLGSYIFCIWLCSRILHVSLVSYISGSLHFIDGYNDAMFRLLEDKLMIYFYGAIVAISIIAGLLIFILSFQVRKSGLVKNLDLFFIFGLTSLGIFVLFKSSFVRSESNIFLFFDFVSLFAIFLYLCGPKGFKRKATAVCCWAVLIISSWAVNRIPGSYKPYLRIANLSFIPIKIGEIKNYLHQMTTYRKELEVSDSMEFRNNEYKAIIGNHSVDIVPAEISRIFLNGLRYNPAPVIQSYAAYNEFLVGLNYAKYMSGDAPDFILFSGGTIDDRYAFFDEAKAKIALLGRYEVAGRIHDDLLLRKREHPLDLQPSKEETVMVRLGEDIPVKKSKDLQFSKIIVSYGLWGRLRRMIYQPPSLNIILTLENGEERTFRAIVPILAAGVIVNKYVSTEMEFQQLMQSSGMLGVNIKKIRIVPESPASGFLPDIRMVNTYYSFPDKSPSDHLSDSLGLVKLQEEFNSFKPVLIDPAGYQQEHFPFGFNGPVSNYAPIISSGGWAFRENDSNLHNLVKMVFKSGDKVYELPSWKIQRPDVQEYFQRQDVGMSGFTSKVSRSQLPPGDYQLGLVIVDTVHQRGWIQYTDNYVLIKGIYHTEEVNPLDYIGVDKNDMEYGVDLKKDEDKIYVDGWAFIKNGDPKEMTTNLILKNKSVVYKITTDVKSRTDVADHFKNPLLVNSGFYVEIESSQVQPGNYSIGIEKVYPDKKIHKMVYTGQSIKINMPDVFIPTPLTELLPDQDFNLGFDFIKDEKNMVAVSGWAIQKMNEVENCTIEVVLKGEKAVYVSATEVKSRPDVTAHFKNKFNLDDCGFIANISKKPLLPGKYEVGVRIYQNGKKGTVKFSGQFITKE